MCNLRKIISNIGFGEGFANYGAGRLLKASDFDATLVDYAIAASMIDYYLVSMIEIGVWYNGWGEDDIADAFERYLYYRPDSDVTRALYEEVVKSRYVFVRYGVGEAVFQELRSDYEARKGADFSEIQFFKDVLDIGSCPFNILEEELALK
jgi:uncharacterized protein (DUF885 family)